jgi:hypothetical protein
MVESKWTRSAEVIANCQLPMCNFFRVDVARGITPLVCSKFGNRQLAIANQPLAIGNPRNTMTCRRTTDNLRGQQARLRARRSQAF